MLSKLASRCNGPVCIDINEHKGVYQTVEQYVNNHDIYNDGQTSKEVISKMIETDTIICVQFYPDTAIGFYNIYHWDIDLALKMANEVLEEKHRGCS